MLITLVFWCKYNYYYQSQFLGVIIWIYPTHWSQLKKKCKYFKMFLLCHLGRSVVRQAKFGRVRELFNIYTNLFKSFSTHLFPKLIILQYRIFSENLKLLNRRCVPNVVDLLGEIVSTIRQSKKSLFLALTNWLTHWIQNIKSAKTNKGNNFYNLET